MSWLYSQALVAEYLGDIFSDGEQSVQLSGNLTQQAYLSQDKMTDFSRLSRFGMTFKPLTENLGEELLTLYREDFHVRTCQSQEKAQELTESEAECGEKWHGLLARFDPDTHLWRTVQCSLLEDLNESLQTLPQWGMTVGGELYLLPTLVQTTKEKESGLWLTPSTVDIPTRSTESMEKRLEYRKKIGRNGVGAGCLSEQVEWSGKGQPIGYITKETWPTPDANCGARGTQELWTPKRKSGHQAQYSINQAVRDAEKFPTPNAWDGRRGPLSKELYDKKTKQISLVTHIRHSALTPQNGGQLNPEWVEWLMGWMPGWTDLKRLETDKCPCVLQPLGES
jgi:hypothetical protein